MVADWWEAGTPLGAAEPSSSGGSPAGPATIAVDVDFATDGCIQEAAGRAAVTASSWSGERGAGAYRNHNSVVSVFFQARTIPSVATSRHIGAT